ncbi:transposase [Bacteroidia bacterium]|nr:transposase [Bacteroidia bacterium]
MSYVRIWVHVVFSIKDRTSQILEKTGRHALLRHIQEQCAKKEIYLDCINGYLDHLHLLISLGKQQTIANVMQNIKGESSFWANRQRLFRDSLEWQDDYYAVSVSESQVNRVRRYILMQEQHHSKKTYAEEADRFMKIYGWSRIKDE